jgi:HEAT repeat protein
MASFQLSHVGLLGELVAQLRSEGNSLVKATLVKAVGRFQDPEFLDLLSRFLSDPDARVRANAVESLGFYQIPEIVPLLNPMTSDEASRVRGNALLVIGRFHRQKILTHVNQMALSGDPQMRETAVYVLSRIGGEYAARRFAVLYDREPFPALQEAIGKCLQRFANQGVPEAAEAWEKIQVRSQAEAPSLEPSPPPLEIPAAETPLVENWPTSSSNPPSVERPACYPADLHAASSRRRLEAVQMAPDSGGEVFGKLRDLLETEMDEFVIATLVKKLGKVGGEAAFSLLLPYTRNPDGRIRANALEGLDATGSAGVLEVARGLLEDSHPRVRSQAARILAKQGREQGRAVAVLKEMLLEGDEKGALSAVHALEAIDASVILEVMELALVQPQPRIRSRVLMALQVMGENNALAARLAEKYTGSTSFEDEEHVHRLLGRMNSRDEEVRYQALRHLSLVRSEKVQSRIELATCDASEKVRNLALALVEDFGKAYQRQGVLHSLGVSAVEALRAGRLELNVDEELSDLDSVTNELGAGEAGAEEAPRLLARRREILVSLGERVYREIPGCQEEGIQRLLAHLRDLEDVPISSPPSPGGVSLGGGTADEVLQATMREIQENFSDNSDLKAMATAKTKRKGIPPPAPPTMAERAMDLGRNRTSRKIMLLLLGALAAGGLFFWVKNTLHSGLVRVSKAWAIPVDSRCYVKITGDHGFSTTQQGEALAFALPTGTVKWRRSFESLIPKMILAGDEQLVLFSRLDQVLGVQVDQGNVIWTKPAGGGVLPGAILQGGVLVFSVRKSSGSHEVVCYSESGGKKLWNQEISTGVPGGLNLEEGMLLFTSGSTLYGLDAESGEEHFSYDHGDDFLTQGKLFRSSEGTVMVATKRQIVGISSSGVLDLEGPVFKKAPLLIHPILLAEDHFLILAGGEAVLLDANLQEVDRLTLPWKPTVFERFPSGILLSDGSNTVLRVRLDQGGLRLAGKSQVTGLVASLSWVGGNVLVGSRSGIEIFLESSFGPQ